jgi:hippurate hydrolase|tara:strand:- start:166 stop:1353 length:1188 start_codon:yes stop_codon:yes gene_type:complete
MMNVIQSIADFQDELTKWRRDIHAHPELGFEEERTAKLVAEKLQSFGLDVQRGLGKTGVVATLQVGNSHQSIGLRADMDALPILESNQFGHRSKYPGKMHACGHDGHTVMLLAAARYLAESKNFDGCVRFIFQPAEEGLGGAEAMLLDGLLEQFPMEAVFGMHNSPGMPVGKFAILSGPMMAGGAYFDIHVDGKGAHGAHPSASIDPVIAAAHITTGLQTIVSRNVAPTQPLVISVTQIHSGDAYNVIPQTAVLSGTVRAFSKTVLAMAEERMGKLAKSIAAGFGATAELDFRIRFLPLVNQPEEADFAADTAAELVGQENIHRDFPLIMASEDFSYMLDNCPGAYINIGNGDHAGSRGVHNPGYEFNDEILALGASYYARLVERRLVREGPQDA